MNQQWMITSIKYDPECGNDGFVSFIREEFLNQVSSVPLRTKLVMVVDGSDLQLLWTS
jgi:hypothetical protein